jgi:uncharacterized protein with NRDE domain
VCTLIALVGLPGLPRLVLAANRDEFLARETAPTSVFEAHGVSMVGGRDKVAGGSWLAFGPRVVAGLTNDRSGGIPYPGTRSRGALVTRAAASADLAGARAVLEEDEGGYGPFHLLLAAGDELLYAHNQGERIEVRGVEPGVHVLGNYGLDDEGDPIVANIHGDLRRFLDRGPSRGDLLSRTRAILMRHGPGWPCVHMGIYGTRYSALAVVDDDDLHLEVTEAASCQVGHSDHTGLLRAVRTAG